MGMLMYRFLTAAKQHESTGWRVPGALPSAEAMRRAWQAFDGVLVATMSEVP
jgi:hypothetical protein